MALPNDKISTTLVANTLGTSSRDVGTLCTHQAINKWSKWKPVRLNTNGNPLTDANRISVRSGMSIPMVSSEDELINYYRNNPTPQWGYNKPTNATGYRLGDFRGYEHTAYKFYEVDIPSKVLVSGNSTIPIGVLGLRRAGNMFWEDLMFEDLYVGAVIVRANAITPRILTYADLNLGAGVDGDRVDAVAPSRTVGVDYHAFVFVGEKSSLDPNIMSTSFILENGFKTFRFVDTAEVNFNGTNRNSNGRVDWVLKIINNTAHILNLTNSSIRVRYADNLDTDPLELGEQEQILGTINVPINGEYNNSGLFMNTLPDYSTRGGYIQFLNPTYPDLNTKYSL